MEPWANGSISEKKPTVRRIPKPNMARTKQATSRKPSSSRSSIQKQRPSAAANRRFEADNCPSGAEHLHIAGSMSMRIVQRGLIVQEAVELCRLFKCSVAQLLGMYKCRKTRIHNAVDSGRQYVQKRGLPCFHVRGDGGVFLSSVKKQKARKQPPRKSSSKKARAKKKPPSNNTAPKDEVVLWIGDALETWIPMTPDVHVGQTVLVQALDASKQAGLPVKTAVKVTDMYEHKVVLGGKGEVAMADKWSIIGKLLDPIWVDTRLVSKGVSVRFYTEHVQSVHV